MKKHHMPEMKEGGVNVTPLIDIVMCLIIFYMLVAHIGVDTGTTHLASASGTPVVALYSHRAPIEQWAPMGADRDRYLAMA